MLYKKNQSETLAKSLFEHPTSEYRCAPFWAWNCRLNQELLNKEIEDMKIMGFGGFHMHSRTGMATPYLSDDFMALVKGCIDKAKEEDMLAWLYDEDRWPSGSAGGLVTKDPQYRQRSLLFTTKRQETAANAADAYSKGLPCLLAVYDIVTDADGMLQSYVQTGEEEPVSGIRWFAYMMTAGNDPWYNGQSYIDTLSKKAVRRFIDITHETYAKAIGDEFDRTVPAIFTDEPQFSRKSTLSFPTDTSDITLPWTPDLPETFSEKYGYDLIPHLPELFWELPEGRISAARYHYHDHICDRFTEAFADTCGEWCSRHGISMTGHMMAEGSLYSQTSFLGEAMRSYRRFAIPGIDMLCNAVELSTAKQAASAVHQYGREAMLSELYGVTDWDFDFRGHKFQGDWQAALGVTVRVPHLFWVSMEGEAKRDYPAAIGYQSPWYREYSFIEDHFARVNTAMTRGKPEIRVGILHPIESYWLHFGPKFMTEAIRSQMESHFQSLIGWMLGGLVDFDFISESLLPEQIGSIENDFLPVGAMSYHTILVPELETMRRSTLDILNAFRACGGRIVFLGSCPRLIDAVPSDEVRTLYDRSEHAAFDQNSVLQAVEQERVLDIRQADGTRPSNLLYQMRRDTDCTWIFLAHQTQNNNLFISKPQDLLIRIRGEYTPVLYQTLSGETEALSYTTENNTTVIRRKLYASDSLLLKLLPQAVPEVTLPRNSLKPIGKMIFRSKVPYQRTEPNVLLLDYAKYKWDTMETYRPKEEILRLDNAVRAELSMPPRQGHIVQPWVFEPEMPEHVLTLRMIIHSEIDCSGTELAVENAENLDIVFNNEPVAPQITGYFTDASIQTIPMPILHTGDNELIITMPFGRQTNTEWCYLLGNFNVRLEGCDKTICAPTERIGYQSVTTQGMPFYGGNIRYEETLDVPEDCTLSVQCGAYRGAVVTVELDGERAGVIAFEPYTLTIPNVSKGKHQLTFVLNGTRFNCFGALHNTNAEDKWAGPNIWRTSGDRWCDEYRIRDMGILTSPSVTFLK